MEGQTLGTLAWSLVLGATAIPLSALATGRLIRVLIARQIMDNPNERSSHTRSTPRGGGLAVMAVVVALTAVLWAFGPGSEAESGGDGSAVGTWGLWAVLACTLVLMALSFADDLKGLGPLGRLLVHLACVAVGLAALPAGTLTLGGVVPDWLGAPLALGAWVWCVNLTNFMDGIDGISGVQTAAVGVGVVAVALTAGLPLALMGSWLGVAPVLAGAALGFLVWNWHPAKVFLGDVGSVPIGYLTGALLLVLIGQGQWAAALILPAYYLTDATLTLGRRLLHGQKIWQAHRQHAYQKAVIRGWRHSRASGLIALGNTVLNGLALLAAAGWPWPALAAAVAVVAAMIAALTGGTLPGPDTETETGDIGSKKP